MTSRERLLNTIYRRPTDRVPISLYELCQFEGSSYAWFANQEPSYANLMKVMSEKTDCIMQTEASIRYPEIEKITETETWREGESSFCRTTLHTPKGNLTSLCRTDDNIFTTWTLEHFLKEPEDIEKYQSLDFTCMVDNTHMLDDQQRVGEGGLFARLCGIRSAGAQSSLPWRIFSSLLLLSRRNPRNSWIFSGS